MPPRYPVALFDLDGTLCDPGSGITDAVQHALGTVGVTETDARVLRRYVGPPLEHAFRDVHGLAPAAVDVAVGHYRAHYRAHGLGRYRAYEGVAAVLEQLAGAGVHLGVVTAKLTDLAEDALTRTGLRPWFSRVDGRGPDEVVTKDVTLGHALARLDRPASDVVMVGDREHDVDAARAHGVASLGVLYGFGTEDELTRAGATALARTVEDVARLLLPPA